MPVILSDLEVFSCYPVYLTHNRQFSPENTAFITEGIVTDRTAMGLWSHTSANVIGSFSILTYYRSKDLLPSTLQFQFDFDVARLKVRLKDKGLYPDRIHVLEKLFDPGAKTVTVWKDAVCDLGPIENGRRKLALNAVWPIAYKGDRYPYKSREFYDLDINVSRAVLRHLAQKVLDQQYTLAVEPRYMNDPSRLHDDGKGLVERKGYILLDRKIVGSFDFNNWVDNVKKPMAVCHIYWAKGMKPLLKPEILKAASETKAEVKDPNQISWPLYSLDREGFRAVLPLSPDLKTVAGDTYTPF